MTVDDAEAERLIALGHAEESDADEDAVDLTVSVLVEAEVQPKDEPVVEPDKDKPKAERATPKKRETREAKNA